MTERKTIIRNLLIVVIIMLVAVFCIVVEQDTANCCAINSMSAVEIEDVQAGDKVLARNDKTGEVEEKEVTKTFEEQAGEIVKLTVDDEVIETTTGHPVYAEHRGYVAASQLRAGDILVDVNGEKKVVEKIQHEILEKPITVYNLEVADDHNYYVGKTSVLVHNVGACGVGNLVGKQVSALQRYTLATGQNAATVLKLIYDGVLTWNVVYTLVNINQIINSIREALEEVVREDDNSEAVYRFASITSRGLEKHGPKMTLEEIVALICLRHEIKTGFKNDFVEALYDIVGDTINLFKPYKDKKVGVYTESEVDAQRLTLVLYRYICNKHKINYSEIESKILMKDMHFYHYIDVGKFDKTKIIYLHYHVYYTDKEYNYDENIWPDHIHLFFGQQINFNVGE